MKGNPATTRTSSSNIIPYVLLMVGNKDITLLLHSVLAQELHWGTLKAFTAQDALHIVSVFKPDLFVIDQHLPGSDGIDLYDQLHANPALSDVPALILSSTIEECRDRIEQRQLFSISLPSQLDALIKAFQNILAPDYMVS